MNIYKLAVAAGSVITVTNSATALTSLIDTAAGQACQLPSYLDGVDMYIEGGDIRVMLDGNSPTTTVGLLLKSGTAHNFRGIPLSLIKMITVSGTSAVSIAVGQSGPDEANGHTASGSSGGTVTTSGADGESNTANTQQVEARLQGFNGTTWDRIRAGITGIVSAVTGYLNDLPFAQYLSSAATLTNAQFTNLYTTVNGFLKVSLGDLLAGEDLTNKLIGVLPKPVAASTYSPSLYSELTQVTKANIKASGGNVLSIYISNANAAVRYFQLHNKATAPAGADVPIYSFPVPAGTANSPGTLILDSTFWTLAGQNFGTGIGWAISTTYGTFTDSATAGDHVAYVHYV